MQVKGLVSCVHWMGMTNRSAAIWWAITDASVNHTYYEKLSAYRREGFTNKTGLPARFMTCVAYRIFFRKHVGLFLSTN